MSNLIILKKDSMRGKRPMIEPSPGTFIAGGAIRAWFDGGTSRDIDVFGVSKEQLDAFVSEKLPSWELTASNPITRTFTNGKNTVQVIDGKPFPSVNECIGYFDFTICQFGWDGESVVTTPLGIISTLRKHLAVNTIHKEHALDSMRRAFKYQRDGFDPCFGTLKSIADVIQSLTPEEVKSQIEISPNGGLRSIRFD